MSEAVDLGAWLRAKAAQATGRSLQEQTPGRPETASVAPVRRPDGRFPKGVSGNPAGRPKGLRDRLAGDLLTALADDFAAHGADAVRRLREGDPAAYLALVLRVAVPALRRDGPAEPAEQSILARLDPAELVQLRRQLEEAVALARAGAPLALPPILAAEAANDGAGEPGDG
jgi:hypothetical protein